MQRYNFKETQSGPVKASELFRNTNIRDRNPIVPDSTENDQAADPYTGTAAPFVFSDTGTNWKASLMRNSIKRYFATQSGTDINFEMGLFTASGGKGIDWDGQGVADAVGSVTGNITRNIYKEIRITGTCGSTDTGVDGTTGSGPGTRVCWRGVCGFLPRARSAGSFHRRAKPVAERTHGKSGWSLQGNVGQGDPGRHSPDVRRVP